MKRKKIVLIEDMQDHAAAIIAILDNFYDVYPKPGTRPFENLVSCYSSYNSRELVAPIRKERRTKLSEFLLKHADASAYIVDYLLKTAEGANANNKNGVQFIKNFDEEMGSLPVLFLTGTTEKRNYGEINDLGKTGKRQFDLMLKPDDLTQMETNDFANELLDRLKRLIGDDDDEIKAPS